MALPHDNLENDATDCDIADQYSLRLLNDLGVHATPQENDNRVHPAKRWAEAGLMTLTGDTPTVCPVPLASCADGALNAFRTLSETRVFPEVSGADLLAERAAITGRRGNGADSVEAHCRILPCKDGTIAVNLSRTSDWDLLPAWLETGPLSDWSSIELQLQQKTAHTLVSRGRLLGLAVTDARPNPARKGHWVNFDGRSGAIHQAGKKPVVVDLSSLWAGPLCSSLWQAAGAEVIKVESTQRPDGARNGAPAFFELLNQGKQTVALDLHLATGQRDLLHLIREADIVLEGSRPRALRQMGIVAEELVAELPHLTWLGISGYGRIEPRCNWIAYGDDAGVAAGLSDILHQVTGEWIICGDAIADPLTGLHAALAGWASWLCGGGQVLDLSLEQTVRYCIAATAPGDGDYRNRQARWKDYLHRNALEPQAPVCKRAARPSIH